MGVRLYPITNDPAKWEKMARVPAGTAARLRELEKRFTVEDRLLDIFYTALYQSPLMARLSEFELSGWGKRGVTAEMGYSGSETDPVQVAEILRRVGVEYDPNIHGEGVHWS